MANYVAVIGRNERPTPKRFPAGKPNIILAKVDGDPAADEGTEAPVGSIVSDLNATLYFKSGEGSNAWTKFMANDYVVGPEGSGAPFESIQAAIDAALADGKNDVDAGAVVLVQPGTYVEDITMHRGIFLTGATNSNEGCNIIGTVTCNIEDAGVFPPFKNVTGMTGFAIQPTTGAGILFGGTAPDAILILERLRIVTQDSFAMRLTNASTWFVGGPRIAAFDCSLSCNPGYAGPLVSVEEDSLLNFYSGTIGHGNQANIAVQVIDRADGFFDNSDMFGQLVVSSSNFTSAGYAVKSSYIQTAAVPAVVCDSDVFLDGVTFATTAADAVSGTGNVIIGTPFSTLGGDGGVNVSGTVSMRQMWQGSTVASSRWATADPVTIQEALDRMIELLYTLNSNTAIP